MSERRGAAVFTGILISLAVIFTSLLPHPVQASPVQGDHIVNAAVLASKSAPQATTAVTVTIVVRTPSKTEFLQYAPTLATADKLKVSTTYFRSDSDPSSPFKPMSPPTIPGSSPPIDLTQSVPLAPATVYHAGDPIFIKVTDKDQNLDRTVAETALITITDDKTGDVEVIRLTETGPDTGIFIGYIQSTLDRSDRTYSGIIPVVPDSRIKTIYTDSADSTDTSNANALVDPYGILIDSKTGKPVDGVKVTLLDAATGKPATILGDDGVSSFPSTITTGSTTSDASGRNYSFPPGGYRFPFINPGNYKFEIVPPPGYAFPSEISTDIIQALPGGPFTIVNPGSRGEQFIINPGPAIRFDIPIDPIVTTLWVVKTANKDTVSQGDFILYTVTVQNTGKKASAPQVQLIDRIPQGFRFKSGSVRIDGQTAADPLISADGRSLSYALGDIAQEKSREVRYVLEVSAGAHPGVAINLAQAIHALGGTSNQAKAAVKVQDQFNRGKTLLMGRVMSGSCAVPDTEKPGMEDVRFYLEDGTFVDSDKQGMFHFEGIKPGVHVVQLDLDSLPKGYEVLACEENTRFAGRSFSQFVDLKGGAMWRVDFYVKGPDTVRPKVRQIAKAANPAGLAGLDKPETEELAVVPKGSESRSAEPVLQARGESRLELKSNLTDRTATFRVIMGGSAVPMKNLLLSVSLSKGSTYSTGSSTLDGTPLPDPEVNGTLLTYKLADKPGNWKNELKLAATFRKALPTGELPCAAILQFDSPTERGLRTPVAENILVAASTEERIPFPEFTVRPQFPSLVAALSDSDKQMLDELVRMLSIMSIEQIYVTGHTDSARIAPERRHVFKDNQALSLARARSVGNYLIAALHHNPEKLVLAGMGESRPIASNRDPEGKALNRRVEVRVKTSRVVSSSGISLLKDSSDPKSVPTTGAADSLPEASAPRSSSLLRPVAENEPLPAAADLKGATVQPEHKPASEPSKEDTRQGILAPGDQSRLIHRYNSIRVRFDSKLQQRLLVDGKEVGADRIGFQMVDPNTGLTLLTYLGVDFGQPGEHVIKLEGLDPFGNARSSDTVKVTRTGEVAAIRFLEAAENVADGKTPIRLRLQMVDAAGVTINAPAQMEIRGGTLTQPTADKEASKDHSGLPLVKIDADGWVTFAPTNQSGPYRTELGFEKESISIETYIQPKMRDWILVGLAEGTTGFNSVAGNMEGLKGSGTDEDYYKEGRLAFFAKGTIQGKWLLTTAYDSRKGGSPQGNSLFQTINPEAYYTLYGDASQQKYDAASARNLYVKIERNQFYAMYGDFDTGLTVTELSKYSRRLTGIKTELQSKNAEFNLFASDTGQNFAKDEIQGDGTSGLYHMSKKNILLNSEKITLEVRDRFRSEIVTSSRILTRFTDYSIDYDSGTVFFKEPVMSRDENLNPIFIVIEYEIDASRERSWNYGGRAGLRFFDGAVRAGASHIHESQGNASGNLYGVDTTIQLGPTSLKGEFATTSSDLNNTKTEGHSYLTELAVKTKLLDTKAYFREQEAGFGFNQQAGSEAGTRKFGADAALKVTERFSINALGYRQYNLATSAIRDLEEAQARFTDKMYSVQLGLRQATDSLVDGTTNRSTQLTSGASLTTLKERLTLRINHDQSVGSNNNSDFPTRTTIGADYKVTKDATLFVNEEWTSGNAGSTETTSVGVKANPWSGGQINSSVAQENSENSDRLFALFGLKQTLKITDKFSVDGGLDHSRSLRNKSSYQFNTNVPPANGSSTDFTAVSTGANYKEEKWSWANRLEYRTSDTEDKWGALTGIVGEVQKGLGLSARAQIFTSDSISGTSKFTSDFRFGAAYRPENSRWIILDRIDFLYDELHGGGSDLDSHRIVNNLNANFKPNRETQISLQYGAKYVWELIDGGNYSGYTDLIGVESRYDITKEWDIGIQGSLLHSWSTSQLDYSSGASIGYNIMQNAWISVGYNFCGFTDKDFSAADYTAQGPFARFRFKFDQNSVKEGLKKLGQ